MEGTWMCSSNMITCGVLSSGLVLLIGFFAIRKLLSWHWGRFDFLEIDKQALQDKIIVITGAGSGVGFEVALELVRRGATVVITGRTMKAANDTVLKIRQKTFLGTLIPMELELASLDSVKQFAKELIQKIDKIDILINNAGVLIPITSRQKTQDGFEIHMGVNHISHFLLTSLLLPLIKNAGSARIVVLTSMAHQGIPLNVDDLMFEKTEIVEHSMSGNPLYRASKLANILFVQELARRLQSQGAQINVYACCPGIVKTNIVRNMDLPWYSRIALPIVNNLIFKSANQGAQTVLYCALSNKCANESGKVYRNCSRQESVRFAFPDYFLMPNGESDYSEQQAARLWAESEKLCNINFST